ncbi:MFS transporter [Granulicella sp. dw_53]|uniref:MFS transporter n=1 Tax=Granulicella sp. dw_53 TaxID=2719792 RepID=UPI0021046CAB|nr:MFS transporter [Granulicella sp. dw_53]
MCVSHGKTTHEAESGWRNGIPTGRVRAGNECSSCHTRAVRVFGPHRIAKWKRLAGAVGISTSKGTFLQVRDQDRTPSPFSTGKGITTAGLATAIILSGVSLGTVAGVPAGTLVSMMLGWRLAFVASAIVALSVLLAVMILVPSLVPTSTRGIKDVTDLLNNRKVRFGLLGTVLSFIGQFAGYTYITPFMLQVMHFDSVVLSAVLFGFGAAGVAGNLFGGWAVGKNVRVALAGTLLLLGTSILILTVVGAHLVVAVPLILIWGFGFGMQPIATQSWMFSAAPDQLESVQAIFVSAAQLSIGSGALIGGLMFDHFGIYSTLWIAASTAFVTAALFSLRSK